MKYNLRLVIDTNVFISALIFRGGRPRAVLQVAQRQGVLPFSKPTDSEFRTVLLRDKFKTKLSVATRVNIYEKLVANRELVDVRSDLADCRDPKDNKFLTLALDGKADYIISGDQDLLVLHPWRGIDILSPADFVVKYG